MATLSFTTASVTGGSSLTINQAITGSLSSILILSIKVEQNSPVGGTHQVEIYTKDTFQAADIVYRTDTWTGTYVDPVENDDEVLTERNWGLVTLYVDEDSTGELHLKIFNNDSSDKTYDVTIEYAIGIPTITNESNNRVLTSLGAGLGANAEANLTFDGTTLTVTGSVTQTGQFLTIKNASLPSLSLANASGTVQGFVGAALATNEGVTGSTAGDIVIAPSASGSSTIIGNDADDEVYVKVDGAGGVLIGPNDTFNSQDPATSGHNHNLIGAPDFWYDPHHRRVFARSVFFGEIADPVDIAIRRATGTYPDTLGSSALSTGDTIGHIKWYPWNGTSYQGAAALVYCQTAEVPTASATGGNLYFGTCPITSDGLGSSARQWLRIMHSGVMEMYTRTAAAGSSTPYQVLAVTSGGVIEVGDDGQSLALIAPTTYTKAVSSATPATGNISATKGTGTNIAGAALTILGGASTGNALPGPVYLKSSQYVSETSATTERTPITRYVAGLAKVTTDGASTDLFSVPLGSPEMIAFRVQYAVHARSGGNTQVETGHVDFLGVNLGGVFTMGTPTPVMSQALSAGTLSVTFAISAANPAVVSVTVDTSLTPTSGWPRINYSIENLSPTEITIL